MKKIISALLLPLAIVGCSDKETVDPASVAHGKELFVNCSPCHSLEKDNNGVGPSLHSVIGRKAGTAEGYEYSEAMKKSGITWSAEQITKFIQNPAETVPETSMVLSDIDAKMATDIVNYLKSQSR